MGRKIANVSELKNIFWLTNQFYNEDKNHHAFGRMVNYHIFKKITAD